MAEETILYVAPAGQGIDCTRAEPCGTFSEAIGKITAARNTVLVAPGSYSERVAIANANLTISAMGADLSAQTPGQLIDITGSSIVSIRGLRIHSGLGVNGDGIRSSDQGGNSPSVTLRQVTIEGNGGKGISASGGALTVTQSTVSGNQGGGISASGGTLTVAQCTVSGNQGGGISAMNATFDITNNFIFRNGNSTTATIGGASLAPNASGVSSFAFNTVVDNLIQNSAALSGGVFCDTAGFMAANNIIVRNFVNNDAGRANANTSGICVYPSSTIATTVDGLAFVSPDSNPYNYHLAAGSSAIDQATTASTVTVDIDGDSRPQGAQKDIGADEYKAN